MLNHRLLGRALVLALLLSGIARADDLGPKFDEYMTALNRESGFIGSVLVTRDGKPLFEKGYGLANAELNVPNTPQTKFRLGSVTKQFTAVLVLQLEQEKKLAVTDHVCQYVQPCPKEWADITLHHLLTHTSGLPNFTAFPDYKPTQTVPSAPSETLKRFSDKPLEFKPGQRFAYSNSGYVLLGYIVEKVSGKSYEQLLQEHIFGPLGMKNSGYDHSTTILPNRAAGYAPGLDGLENAHFIDMSIPHAAGALYSTVEDLSFWEQALSTEKLLPKAALERIFTPVKSDYGYGWIIKKVHDRRVIWHNGGIDGFASNITRFPDDHVAVFVLANSEAAPIDLAARDLAAIVFGEKYELPKGHHEIALNPSILPRYVGEYELAPTFSITITAEDGKLYAQATHQDRFRIYPESETEFFLRVVDAQLTFVRDPAGNAVKVVLHQNGHDMTGRKKL